jgi:hypothetical protein
MAVDAARKQSQGFGRGSKKLALLAPRSSPADLRRLIQPPERSMQVANPNQSVFELSD